MGSLQWPGDKEKTSEIEILKEEYVELQRGQGEARQALEEKMEAFGLRDKLKANGTAVGGEKATATPIGSKFIFQSNRAEREINM